MWLIGRKRKSDKPRTLAELFGQARRQRQWTRHECARQAGYTNVAKGCRRLCEIERGEVIFADERVLARFAAALDIPDEQVRRSQRLEIERHDEVGDPQILVRWAPQITAPLAYDGKSEPRRVINFATRFARQNQKEVCVKLSEVRAVHIRPDGSRTEQLQVPWTCLDGDLPRAAAGVVA